MASVHPSDLQIVDSWAAGVRGDALDAGCGPGHWTNHLHEFGLSIRGIDLVPAFIDHARSTYPGIRFDLCSIDDIDVDDGAFGGILSWFSTIHHEPDTIAVPISEFARVLRPGGRLVLGFFSGPVIEAFDHAVVTAYRWPPDRMRAVLEAAGFDIVETHLRESRGHRPVGAIVSERRRSGPDGERPSGRDPLAAGQR